MTFLLGEVTLSYFGIGNKGGQKMFRFFSGPFIRPTSDVDFSETVCRIYIKISQFWVHISVPNLWNFYVNPTNRFRGIDVGSWPNKWTRKNGTLFFGHPLLCLGDSEISCFCLWAGEEKGRIWVWWVFVIAKWRRVPFLHKETVQSLSGVSIQEQV